MNTTELLAREKSTMKLYYGAQRKVNKALECYEAELRKTREELQQLLFDMKGNGFPERDIEMVAIEFGKVNNMVNNLNAIKALVNPF